MRRLFAFAIAAIFSTVLALSVRAQHPDAQAVVEYELRNLLVHFPPGLDTAAVLDRANRPADDSGPSRVELVATLTRWLRDSATTAEPDIRIDEKDRTLAIRATSRQHERIAALIEMANERRRVQVTCETRLLQFEPAAEATLDESLVRKLAIARTPGGVSQGGIELTQAEATALLEAAQQNPRTTMLTAPRITVLDGQLAGVLVQTQRALVTGHKKIRDEAGNEKWEPVTEASPSGVTLDVRCRAGERDQIAAQIKFTLTRLLDIRQEPFTEAPDEKLTIDVPVMETQTVDALASLESGTMLLFRPEPSGATDPNDPRRTYVLFRATIEQR